VYVTAINWDLSPSSARKTRPRLTSMAVSKDNDLSTRGRRPRGLGRRHLVEGLAHRPERFAGRAVRQCVDSAIGDCQLVAV
jgi:hypothetical protein